MPESNVVTDRVRRAITSSVTHVLRQVDICQSNGETIWRSDVPFIDGTVTVDASSESARRTFELTLDNTRESLEVGPNDALWYDKVIKIYRGVRIDDDEGREDWWYQIGEFLIDDIDTESFPSLIQLKGQDYNKRLTRSKFGRAIHFSRGRSMKGLAREIALVGHITKFADNDNSGPTTEKDFLFEPDDDRSKSIHDIVTAYGYEYFFDHAGRFLVREMRDPSTSPPFFTFKTGEPDGSLIHIKKNVNDTRLYNHVVVTGESTDAPPVVGEARNTSSSSPTNVERIGERTLRYNSTFITTQAQAQSTANSFLATRSLEEFNIRIEALVVPWLEGSEVIRFEDPAPFSGQPQKFFLRSFTIPLGLGSMNVDARRVEIR